MLDIWTCSQPLHDISDISFNVTLNIAQLYSIIPNHSIFCALEVLWCLFSCSCLLPFWQLSLPYWLLEGTRTTFETGMRLYFPYSCVPCIRGAICQECVRHIDLTSSRSMVRQCLEENFHMMSGAMAPSGVRVLLQAGQSTSVHWVHRVHWVHCFGFTCEVVRVCDLQIPYF